MHDIRLFLQALRRHLGQTVSGALATIIGLVWQVVSWAYPSLTWPKFRPWMLWAPGIALCGWAAFLAWRDEHYARLNAESQKGNRPSLAPRSYKKRLHKGCGLTVTNSEYDAYDVRIPDAPIGDSGYALRFDGIYSQLLHKEKAFFNTWIVNQNSGVSSRDGGYLFALMFELDIEVIYFGIISKDTTPKPNWYRDNCSIKRAAKEHQTGLVLKHIDQDVIPEPL